MLAGRPVSSELSGGRSDPEKPQARTKFKAPGAAAKFSLKSASWGLVPFSIHQRTRLTLAYYPDGQENGFWVVTNVGDALHLNRLDATDRVTAGRREATPVCCKRAQHLV